MPSPAEDVHGNGSGPEKNEDYTYAENSYGAVSHEHSPEEDVDSENEEENYEEQEESEYERHEEKDLNTTSSVGETGYGALVQAMPLNSGHGEHREQPFVASVPQVPHHHQGVYSHHPGYDGYPQHPSQEQGENIGIPPHPPPSNIMMGQPTPGPYIIAPQGEHISMGANISPPGYHHNFMTTRERSQKPKRKRIITHDQRKAANIRERRRMMSLNEAFDILRQTVPTFHYEKKLSRIETLRLAIGYIYFMTEILNGKEPKEISMLSTRQPCLQGFGMIEPGRPGRRGRRRREPHPILVQSQKLPMPYIM